MELQKFFQDVVDCLKKEKLRYALAGGLVASIYRTDERLTKDLDFLLLAEAKTEEKAAQIIKSFGLKPLIVRKADLEGGPMFAIKRKSTKPYIIAGRAKGDPSKIGLDFILPEMPWFEAALDRAENNQIDFGFGKVPCLRVEDLIISKFYSLKNDSKRFNDLDDHQSIFEAGHDLDLAYLCGQMKVLSLSVPAEIKEMVPKAMALTSKFVVRSS